jgi:hypothetical protein
VGTGANGSNTYAGAGEEGGTAAANASKAKGSIGRCAVEAVTGTGSTAGAERD